jgi:glycosyltransferase involved in cell wall biosynthesis
MRLAFVGPLPPAPTGIADYDVDVLQALAPRHEIVAFTDQPTVDLMRMPRSVLVRPAAHLGAAEADLVVYQMGNGAAHAFMYPWLVRRPGLLVLHDLVLHHARAKEFLDAEEVRAYAAAPSNESRREAASVRLAAYRAEAEANHPSGAGRLAAVHLATTGRLLPYAYPMARLPAEASRAVAAHNDFVLSAVRAELPGVPAARLVMPMARVPVAPAAVLELRERYGIRPDQVAVGAFGLMTPEKEPELLARAFARALRLRPGLRLLLVGPVPKGRRLDRLLDAHGVLEHTVVTGHVPFEELAAHVELADVVAHLRYPTARETSAALLRVLAQGRATVMTDLENMSDVPADAVLRADPTDEEGAVTRALLRLADSPALRASLGERAAAYVAREHSAARCAESYDAALELAARSPDPPVPSSWPASWRELRA